MNELLIPSENNGILAKRFYGTLTRSGVKTMSDMVETTKVGKKNIKMNTEVMYLRLLAINAMKKVPIERVLSYENSSIPLSLFTEDRSMITPNKSQFMHKLESITGEKITNVTCDYSDVTSTPKQHNW